MHLCASAVLQLALVSARVMTKGGSLSSGSICSCSLILCIITATACCSPSSPSMLDLFGLGDLWISCLCSHCWETLRFDESRCCISVNVLCKTNNVQWEFLLEFKLKMEHNFKLEQQGLLLQ